MDPLSVLKEVSTLFDLGTIFNFFERAGIGAAYLDRWCIDPLDPECPATAPNAFDHCLAFKKFQAWNMAMPKNKQIELEAETISTDKAKLQDDALQIFENIFG
ncbi:unnamed protein product [Brugia timori]|uniref:Uncharacterized protein n=1 Tax=Brugia timori TaxID=42155 RepID=A0A3P7W850_9BILA|nr:unnamed protein product [Brugia timori]